MPPLPAQTQRCCSGQQLLAGAGPGSCRCCLATCTRGCSPGGAGPPPSPIPRGDGADPERCKITGVPSGGQQPPAQPACPGHSHRSSMLSGGLPAHPRGEGSHGAPASQQTPPETPPAMGHAAGLGAGSTLGLGFLGLWGEQRWGIWQQRAPRHREGAMPPDPACGHGFPAPLPQQNRSLAGLEGRRSSPRQWDSGGQRQDRGFAITQRRGCCQCGRGTGNCHHPAVPGLSCPSDAAAALERGWHGRGPRPAANGGTPGGAAVPRWLSPLCREQDGRSHRGWRGGTGTTRDHPAHQCSG